MECLFVVTWILLLQQFSCPLVTAGRERRQPQATTQAETSAAPFGTCNYDEECPQMVNGEGYYRIDLMSKNRGFYKVDRYPSAAENNFLYGSDSPNNKFAVGREIFAATLGVFSPFDILQATCACIQVNDTSVQVKFDLRVNETTLPYRRYIEGTPVDGYYKACAFFGTKQIEKLVVWVIGRPGSIFIARNLYMKACVARSARKS